MKGNFFAQRTGRGSFGGVLRIIEDGTQQLALEDIADGVKREESELCFVARITDASLLSKAKDIVHQEQYEFDLPACDPYERVRMRIRRETRGDVVDDQLTTKSRKPGDKFEQEATVQAPQGLFEIFKNHRAYTLRDQNTLRF
jgi:hypothetical protein